MAADAVNSLTLTGEISTLEPLRHTPGGLPLVNFRLRHRSVQQEAGIERQTELEAGAVAIGEVAEAVAKVKAGSTVKVKGFLAAKRRMGTQLGTQLVFHVTHIQQSDQ